MRDSSDAFARDVLRGLSQRQKSLSSAWFYDERGSRLFEQITEIEEYYLTRCEREILATHAAELGELFSDGPFRVLEIGAGDGHKTEILLKEFAGKGLDFEYVPVDICHRSISNLVAKLRRSLAGDFRVRGIVAEYREALELIRDHAPARNLVLFLGSSIGNFDHRQAQRFLHELRRSLAPRDLLLIGFDLKKDPAILQRAYDDSAGVTREFNLNLLDRINRELGGEFDRQRFQHHAAYNALDACMESYLISRAPHTVPVAALDRSFEFAAWEAIKVESSYKYEEVLIESLAETAGFEVDRHWYDEQRLFVDSLWKAV
jgi:dimethylhistidine N-methyltransferase